jgi:hypothetical protein
VSVCLCVCLDSTYAHVWAGLWFWDADHTFRRFVCFCVCRYIVYSCVHASVCPGWTGECAPELNFSRSHVSMESHHILLRLMNHEWMVCYLLRLMNHEWMVCYLSDEAWMNGLLLRCGTLSWGSEILFVADHEGLELWAVARSSRAGALTWVWSKQSTYEDSVEEASAGFSFWFPSRGQECLLRRKFIGLEERLI